MMTKEDLLKTLEDLREKEFENFKWHLKHGSLAGYQSIKASQLQNAERRDTVDLMVQTYQLPGAVEATKKLLKKINRNDLLQDTSAATKLKALKFCLVVLVVLVCVVIPVCLTFTHFLAGRCEELKTVQQYAVDVTLDPDTAHPNLILSADGKQVHHGDVRKNLTDNPKRFWSSVNVLGKQSLTSGKFYFEVQVRGKNCWDLGVARESINRKKKITLSPENGYWTIGLRNGNEYSANYNSVVDLALESQPQKVGVFVDYEKGLVSFYDVDAAALIYCFTDCSFTEKLYPFFSPCVNDGGKNSAPLIIRPVY